MKSQTTLAVALILLTTGTTGLIVAEAHNPENAASDSNLVVYGTVTDIAGSGAVPEHHPVRINASEVFKGDALDTVTVQVKGTERIDISTAASFTEGEEVVVMLEERDGRYYMTSGYATKYGVENSTIELVAPERKNITVDEMKSIVEDSSPSNQTGQKDSKEVSKSQNSFISRVLGFLGNLFE